MKLGHLEALQPVCPTCYVERGTHMQVVLGPVALRDGDDILQGLLRCPDRSCQQEYPILDGVPLLLPKVGDYIRNNIDDLTRREDLSSLVTGLLSDHLGQNTTWDRARSYLSSYTWGHYGDLDPKETRREDAGSVVDLLRAGLELGGPLPAGPVIDVGASVGRTTFELAARTDDLVLGVDVNFAMLRVAARILRKGQVRYPRRRVGVVYDTRDFAVDLPGRERVDFWACDGQALPFRPQTFGGAFSLNVLDCVSSPPAHLHSLGRVSRTGAPVVVVTPYEWTESATPVEAWLGGIRQRGPSRGRPELILRAMLHPSSEYRASLGLEFEAEAAEVPWRVRLHDRGTVHYAAHVIRARALGFTESGEVVPSDAASSTPPARSALARD